MHYEVQEMDGFQFLASICPCASERVMITDHEDIEYYKARLSEHLYGVQEPKSCNNCLHSNITKEGRIFCEKLVGSICYHNEEVPFKYWQTRDFVEFLSQEEMRI